MSYPSITIGSVTTAATGTNWTNCASAVCSKIVVSNQTGTTIEFRRDGTGTTFGIPSGQFYTIEGLDNASEISFRRVDTSNTQVVVKYEIVKT